MHGIGVLMEEHTLVGIPSPSFQKGILAKALLLTLAIQDPKNA